MRLPRKLAVRRHTTGASRVIRKRPLKEFDLNRGDARGTTSAGVTVSPMAESIRFESGHLRRFGNPNFAVEESLHFHGSLEIRLDDAVWRVPSGDACLNGFAAALAQIRDHVVFGTRSVDPTTYHIHGPQSWPLLEFLRMYDNVRVAALFGGEGNSTVFPVNEFQQAVDGFLGDFADAVTTRRSRKHVPLEDLFSCRCDGFRRSRAVRGHPVWLQSAIDPARTPDLNAAPVICIRVGDMPSDPAAGSLQGQCMRCGTPVWIAPSSRVIIEEQSNPVLCMQCAADESHSESRNTLPNAQDPRL